MRSVDSTGRIAGILQEHGVDYDDQGSRLMVCCPFHPDRNPSAGIWAHSGYFRCFACGVTVDFAGYLVRALGVSRLEAWRIAKSDDGLDEIESRIRTHLQSQEDHYRYFSVSAFHETYPAVEPDSPEYRYVVGRGIRPEMIRRFDMRAGRKRYRHRVVLPVYTPQGHMVSYVGRSVKRGVAPKTRKSRSPHRTLFGLQQVLKHLVTESGAARLLPIVVTEGEFDAIYLQQFGIAAVANMGTVSMGPEKIGLLRKHARLAVLSYDGDEAGQRALYGDKQAVGQVQELRKHVPTVTVQLPVGTDPNELSPEQVHEYYGEYRVGRSVRSV